MEFEKVNNITMTITAIITLWYYLKNGIKWNKKYKKRKLDNFKIQENLKNNRRYDWGLSEEDNWKNTWNPNNPKRHKWIEFFGLIVKTIILMLMLRYGLIIIFAIINGIFFT